MSSAQLMRVGVANSLGLGREQGFENPLRLLFQGAPVQRFVRRDHIPDLFTHANRRMQSQRWFLKDHSDAAPPEFFQLP